MPLPLVMPYPPADRICAACPPTSSCRSALSKALVVTARRWAAVVAPEEADRLTPVVESLSQR
jgi:hypothetical protein